MYVSIPDGENRSTENGNRYVSIGNESPIKIQLYNSLEREVGTSAPKKFLDR